ncbi:MAG TPA: argininosuccinate lyase [Sphingomicrobium sp.]|nr:argininosuccinate lyase [Sphingomicrobium sp.]
MLKLFAFAACGAVLFSGAAVAQGKQDFRLTNKTGYTIAEVYVAPSASEDWEEDVMGVDVLANGDRVDIEFPKREKTCIYDLRVVFDDGDEADWRKFDLCEVSKITIFYNRKSGETTAEYE